MVRESLPTSLLCSWQETLVLNDHLALELDPAGGKKVSLVDIWKQCYLSTCAAIDMEIKQHRGLDPFYSGSTALTVVMQVVRPRDALASSDFSTVFIFCAEFSECRRNYFLTRCTIDPLALIHSSILGSLLFLREPDGLWPG